MLVIRQAQMAVFSSALRENFKRHLAEWLRVQFPYVYREMAGPAWDARIAAGLRQCETCGLETERHIGEYFRLSLSHGPGLEGNPQIAEILHSSKLDPGAKIDLVRDILSSFGKT